MPPPRASNQSWLITSSQEHSRIYNTSRTFYNTVEHSRMFQNIFEHFKQRKRIQNCGQRCLQMRLQTGLQMRLQTYHPELSIINSGWHVCRRVWRQVCRQIFRNLSILQFLSLPKRMYIQITSLYIITNRTSGCQKFPNSNNQK